MKPMNGLRAALAGAALIATASAADAATYAYVGSWQVGDGQDWTTVPAAYSGKDAAALLFGGNAADYVISTVDSLAANIDFKAWVSTWGGACGGDFPCGTKVGDGYVQSTGGFYSTVGDTSAYVHDWAIGSDYTNYAFKVAAVPVPAAGGLLLVALGGLAAAGRRKRA